MITIREGMTRKDTSEVRKAINSMITRGQSVSRTVSKHLIGVEVRISSAD